MIRLSDLICCKEVDKTTKYDGVFWRTVRVGMADGLKIVTYSRSSTMRSCLINYKLYYKGKMFCFIDFRRKKIVYSVINDDVLKYIADVIWTFTVMYYGEQRYIFKRAGK